MLLLAHVAVSVLALSGAAFAAPLSQNGAALAKRETITCDCSMLQYENFCLYGATLTVDDYTNYIKQYYPATDHYILYSGGSQAQVTSFQDAGHRDYYYYNDFFDYRVSQYYLTQWPAMTDTTTGAICYRPDDGDASSVAISKVATSEILVFGAIEYKNYDESWFSQYEVPNLHNSISAGTLNKITHMVQDATDPTNVLATEDSNGDFTFVNGHASTETNASGTYGDCSTTDRPPTCDIPSGNAMIHSD